MENLHEPHQTQPKTLKGLPLGLYGVLHIADVRHSVTTVQHVASPLRSLDQIDVEIV
jgi:hypothetical protein